MLRRGSLDALPGEGPPSSLPHWLESSSDGFHERLRTMDFGARESSFDLDAEPAYEAAARKDSIGATELPSRAFQTSTTLDRFLDPLRKVAASTEDMARLQTGAALGACRERCRELEWRLQRAEEVMTQQTQELVNLRMQNASEAQQERIEARLRRIEEQKEVDSILLRHERRRATQSPPRIRLLSPPRLGQRLGSSNSLRDLGSPPRLDKGLVTWDSAPRRKKQEYPTDSDEAFLRYMADFQLETDRLRARLGIPSSG